MLRRIHLMTDGLRPNMDLWLSYLNFSKRHQTLGIWHRLGWKIRVFFFLNGAKGGKKTNCLTLLVMFRMFLHSSGRAQYNIGLQMFTT